MVLITKDKEKENLEFLNKAKSMLDFNNLDKPNIDIKYGDTIQDGIPTPETPIYPTGKEINH